MSVINTSFQLRLCNKTTLGKDGHTIKRYNVSWHFAFILSLLNNVTFMTKSTILISFHRTFSQATVAHKKNTFQRPDSIKYKWQMKTSLREPHHHKTTLFIKGKTKKKIPTLYVVQCSRNLRVITKKLHVWHALCCNNTEYIGNKQRAVLWLS